MHKILEIKKWLFPISEEDILVMKKFMTGKETSFGTSLLRKYIDLIHPYAEVLGIYNNPREADCLASGIVFFYGCMIYIMHFPDWSSHIEDIFLYNLLYILVDHYIDDNSIETNIKTMAISQMYILVEDPSLRDSIELVDPILKTIAEVYQRLITRCPNTKKAIIKLFQVEVEGCHVQKGNFDRDVYYNIALRKGGYTMQVVNDIMGCTDETMSNASFHIGTIMQLIDDCLDVITDKKNNINTIATFDKDHEDILDNLLLDIVDRINNIDSRFTLFKILYSTFLVYVPSRCPSNYSEEILMLTSPLNLFDFDASTLLVSTISAEATSAETSCSR